MSTENQSTGEAKAKVEFKFTRPSVVKRYALEMAQATRGRKFTRVGSSFLEAVELNARNFIASRVRSHPSIGKTLQ